MWEGFERGREIVSCSLYVHRRCWLLVLYAERPRTVQPAQDSRHLRIGSCIPPPALSAPVLPVLPPVCYRTSVHLRVATIQFPSHTLTDDPACFGGIQTAPRRAIRLHRILAGRFGFHNASAIDNLLDKEDVSLEAILDDDDLLQECKAQNTRLIDYFSRVDVLQRLLGYVTGQIEGDERGSFK